MRLSLFRFSKLAYSSRSVLGQQIADDIEKLSCFQPTPLSIKQFMNYGNKNTSKEDTILFILKELPIRLANIMQEMYLLPPPLLSTPSLQTLQEWYEMSFFELRKIKSVDFNNFRHVDMVDYQLELVRNRLLTVVETMADGIIELKSHLNKNKNNFNINNITKDYKYDSLFLLNNDEGLDGRIKYFLDRFYMSRISMNTLIQQYLGVFSRKRKITLKGFVGEIQTECDVMDVVEDAFDTARFLCEYYYNLCPKVQYIIKNVENERSSSTGSIFLPYFPAYLYHILIEIIKNALRAVVEFHSPSSSLSSSFSSSSPSSSSLPPVKILVCKGMKDITINISDQGGGIQKRNVKRLFNYMFTTAIKPEKDENPPLAGLGYGLPLSKVYARYLSGDLKLYSVDGYGSDAKIVLKKDAREALELLPFFTQNPYSQITQSTQIHDWSS